MDFPRICPKCQKGFDDEIERCPEDGRRLLAVHTDSDRTGEIIDDNFKILGLLGKGGMGVVYRALQISMEREVAIKLLNSSFAQDAQAVGRFLREAKGASRLNHPNIITLFEFGQSASGELYLVMELLEGHTLKSFIGKDRQMTPDRAVALTTQICDALQHAHEMGIVHRDLKPDNIFIIPGAGQYGEFAKVLDFGLAKIRAVDGGQTLTTEGIVCGTPAYMSPEQALSKDLDARSDLYSIGIILYEMMAGSRPFDGGSPVELLMAHVNTAPIPIRKAIPGVRIPTALERTLMQTLSKDAEKRQSSAIELKEGLLTAMAEHEKNPVSTDLKPLDSRQGMLVPGEISDISELEEAPTMVGEASDFNTYQTLGNPAVDAKSQRLKYLIVGIFVLLAGYAGLQTLSNTDNTTDAPQYTRTPPQKPDNPPPDTNPPPGIGDVIETPPADTVSAPPADVVIPQDAVTETPPEDAVETVKTPVLPPLSITSRPAKAAVYLNDTKWEELTPTKIPREKLGESSTIVFKKKGYRNLTKQVSSETKGDLNVRLRKKRNTGNNRPDIEL